MARLRVFRDLFTLLLVLAPLTTLHITAPLAVAQEETADESADDKQRQDDAPKSSREALVLYAEAAGFQNSQQFDLAAEEWESFLKKFADDPRALEARYNLAVCRLQERKFKLAVENLSQVIDKADEKFERLEDAYLNLGWCQYSVALENNEQYFAAASKTFQQLLSKYPEGSFRDQALFFGGESLYLQGKFKEASDSYAELVEKHTKSELHSDAMYALGVTQEDMGEFGAARKIYTAFLKTYPEHDLVTEVQMRKAETVLQNGDFVAAAKMFGKVAEVEGFRSLDHALYRQAFSVSKQAEQIASTADQDDTWQEKQAAIYRRAGTLFGRIASDMEKSPYARDAAIAAGRAHYRAKDFDPASEWFRKIKDSDSPHAPEAAHWLARILLDAQQPAEARSVVASVLESAAKHPFLVSLKLDDADALYQNKATRKESVASYLKIFGDHREHGLAPKALYNAAYGAMEIGDYKNGLAYSEQFDKLFPKHALFPEVQKVVAECKLQLGQHDEAAKVFQKLADSGDDDGTKFELRRGLSLYLKKNYDEAIPVLQKVYQASASRDEQAEAAYYLGRCFVSKNEHEQAIESFVNSRAANSEWNRADEVMLNLARSQRRTGKTKQAIDTVKQLISTYPKSDVLDQAYYRWGEFSYANHDYQSAVQHYSKVISDWPQSNYVPYSLYGRGWAQLRNGKANQGVADFESLQESHPNHKLTNQTAYAMGMALHQAGKHQAALKNVSTYFDTNPNGSAKSDALYLKGLCLAGLKKPTEAIAAFEQLLKEDQKYASADKVLYELAWAYKNAGEPADSLRTFTRLISTSPNSSLSAEAHYHVGEDMYNRKQYEQAADSYTRALKSAKTNDLKEKSAYKLGWSFYQRGEFEKGLTAFDQQLQIDEASNLAADAEFMRGECLFKQSKFEPAFRAYERARNKPSKNETMRVLTLLHGGQSAAQMQEWKVSAQWIAELQQEFPQSAYMPQAIYEQGWAQRNLGHLDTALEAFGKVSSSRNELGARARFMMGEVLFEQKKYREAIREFRRVMFGYGVEKAPENIKRWQAKSGFEAGRCASVLAGLEANPQRRSQGIEEAKGFFQYVIQKHPKSSEATPAKEQFNRLQPGGNRVTNRRSPSGV